MKIRSLDAFYFQTHLLNAVFVCIYQTVVLLFALYQEPQRIGLAMLIIAAGIPVYWVGVLWNSKPEAYKLMISKFRGYFDF